MEQSKNIYKLFHEVEFAFKPCGDKIVFLITNTTRGSRDPVQTGSIMICYGGITYHRNGSFTFKDCSEADIHDDNADEYYGDTKDKAPVDITIRLQDTTVQSMRHVLYTIYTTSEVTKIVTKRK